MPSESSSPDEQHECCYHYQSENHPDQCCRCDADKPEAEPGEPTHKWKRCGCGHPQHASMCRFGGTLDFCGCLSITPLDDIAQTCRLSGGCPDHPADAEAAGEPECAHESWEVTGEHHTPEGWVKSRKCADCKQGLDNIIEAEPHWDIRPAEPETAAKPSWISWEETKREAATAAGESEAPECDDMDESPDCDANDESPAVQRVREELAAATAAPPRRPPYAVAYAVEGGALYEIALPGDASVRAVDGVLVITHASVVLALTDVRPMEGA